MDCISTCPGCGKTTDIDPNATYVSCSRCGEHYDPWDDTDTELDTEPDYGGAFDGFTVSSDADCGL